MDEKKLGRVERYIAARSPEFAVMHARDKALQDASTFFAARAAEIERERKNTKRRVREWRAALEAPEAIMKVPEVENAWTRIDSPTQMGVYILISPPKMRLKFQELGRDMRHRFSKLGANKSSVFELTRPPVLVRVRMPMRGEFNENVKMFDYDAFMRTAKGKYTLACAGGIYVGYPHPQIGAYGTACFGTRHTYAERGNYGSFDNRMYAWWKEGKYGLFVRELQQYVKQVRREEIHYNTANGHPFLETAMSLEEVERDGKTRERKHKGKGEEGGEGEAGSKSAGDGGADPVAAKGGGRNRKGDGEGERDARKRRIRGAK